MGDTTGLFDNHIDVLCLLHLTKIVVLSANCEAVKNGVDHQCLWSYYTSWW